VSVTLDDVRHVASLARLSFSEPEMQRLTVELNSILAYMHHLQAVETENLEPLSHILPLQNVFRQDESRPGLPAGKALENAPAATGMFFRVPKVIGER
jgi:aspartyl-tRNA(Asn)/glutamyl-tRNA(Gln) amidotransferase subunit C